MKNIFEKLYSNESLNYEEARTALIEVSSGDQNEIIISSFLTSFILRPPTVIEIEGFRDALLELCLDINLDFNETIDLCGTGGDGKNTFNISTVSSFVVAGAGYKVTKHGNYGVSSGCGSSNVLEHLGINFTNNSDHLNKSLDKSNICFLHAPLFHPAMKHVANTRKNLGVKTFFNILGPLVNPTKPKNQICGVYNLETLRLYSDVFRNTEKNFMIIYSLDGYDEISLTSKHKIIDNISEQIIDSNYFGFNDLNPKEIEGGSSVDESAKIFVDILENKSSKAHKNVVLANSALAIKTVTGKKIEECIEIANDSLINKKALNSFKNLLKI